MMLAVGGLTALVAVLTTLGFLNAGAGGSGAMSTRDKLNAYRAAHPGENLGFMTGEDRQKKVNAWIARQDSSARSQAGNMHADPFGLRAGVGMPPASGTPITVPVTVKLGEKTIANAVANVMAKNLSGNFAPTGRPDYGAILASPAAGGTR